MKYKIKKCNYKVLKTQYLKKKGEMEKQTPKKALNKKSPDVRKITTSFELLET